MTFFNIRYKLNSVLSSFSLQETEMSEMHNVNDMMITFKVITKLIKVDSGAIYQALMFR